MINITPGFLIFLAWILMGPAVPRPLSSMLVAVVVTCAVAGLALRRSFSGRTVTLLGILGVMLGQSLLIVLASLYVDFLGPSSAHLANSSWSLLPTLRTIDLATALAGIFGAACVAFFANFRKSCGMSNMFPELRFLATPVELRESVGRLASRAGIASPEVWLIDSGLPSAFTVQRNHRYVVAVSVGLLESLDDKEVEACVAHEISHFKNNDFTVRFLATLAKIALFAKPLSYLIEPAVYRAREFLADTTAANLIGGPDALISALSKLRESYSVAASSVISPIGTCNLSGRKGLLGMFDKHPDLGTRIKMLEEMK